MMIIAELKNETGQSLAMIPTPAKEFKTGSKGFYGNSKIEIDGKRYQVQIQIVEIGSKNRPAEE